MMELLKDLFSLVVPLLFFVIIWLFLMRYVSGNKSPMLKIMERQIVLLEQQIGLSERQISLVEIQNDLLLRHANAAERIALALETKDKAG